MVEPEIEGTAGKKHTNAKGRWADPEASQALKEQFLSALREFGTIWRAAKETGVSSLTTPRRWAEADPAFGLAMKEAQEAIADKLENKAIDLALNTDDKSRNGEKTLLHLLRCLHRDKYGDTRRLEHSGPNGSAIPISIANPDAVKAQLIAVSLQFPTIAPRIRKFCLEILEALPNA